MYKRRLHCWKETLAKICQQIYNLSMCGRHFIPKHPYILVRVLPKEHKTEGGIWLAETSQNKVVYEAIVLDTWRPYDEERNEYDEGTGLLTDLDYHSPRV